MRTLKIICLSVDPWSDLWKRKQRLMFELAQRDGVAAVLYVNPPRFGHLFRAIGEYAADKRPPAHRAALLRSWLAQPTSVATRCWTYRSIANAVPMSRLEAIRRLDRWIMYRLVKRCADRLPGDDVILWLYDPFDWPVSRVFPESKLVCLDWTDDWTAFGQPTGIAGPHEAAAVRSEQVVRRSDLVFAVSRRLYERASELGASAVRVPNATDFRALGPASDPHGPIAPELTALPRPIIGYVGQLRQDRIDTHLAQAVARARPDWSFVYVGPTMAGGDEIDALEAATNVYLLGARPYHELASYLRGFDVCVIPHRRDRLIMSMDPIKLYDYMASGKPIVTTPVAGIEDVTELIYVGQDADTFVKGLERALAEDDPRLVNRRLAHAQQNSWESRADLVLTHIHQALEKKRGPNRP